MAGRVDAMADGRLDIDVIRAAGPPGNVLVGPDQQELVGPGVGGRRVEDGERDSAVASPLPERRDARLRGAGVTSVASVAGIVGLGAYQGEAVAKVIVER